MPVICKRILGVMGEDGGRRVDNERGEVQVQGDYPGQEVHTADSGQSPSGQQHTPAGDAQLPS